MGIYAQEVVKLNLFSEQNSLITSIPGLIYIPEHITPNEERNLIQHIDSETWLNDLKRKVQHYGFKYDYRAKKITEDFNLGKMPDWVLEQCKKLQNENIFLKIPDQVIVNEYEPGQGISPHIDCVPCFDKVIASLSLGSSCMMEFTNIVTKQKIHIFVKPRSLIILTEDARYRWQHSIPSRKSDNIDGMKYKRQRRLSLTFRNVLLDT